MATKLMLVEDDINLSEIYQARLQAEGFDIISAKDGEEALALAVNERPDLIICDVMMPRISGFDMLDILRGTAGIQDTKVIMMTALSQAEDKARAEKLGANRYLVKSQVTLEDVVKTVHDVLGDKAQDDAAAKPAAGMTAPKDATGIESKEEESPKDESESVSETEVAPEPPTPTTTDAPTPSPASTSTTDLNDDQTTATEENTVESQIKSFVDNKDSGDQTENASSVDHAQELASSSDSGHSMNKMVEPTVSAPQTSVDKLANAEDKNIISNAETNNVTPGPVTTPSPTVEPEKNTEPEPDPNQIAL